MRQLTVAVLVLGTVVAAQKLRTKGTDVDMEHNVSIPELTEAISARLVAQWEGWKNQDAASNNAVIADDFNSLWPDGSRHIGKPTAQQMSEQPITGYKLSQVRAVAVAADTALVTYPLTMKGTWKGKAVPAKSFASAVWVRRGGKWLEAFYQETPLGGS